MNILHLHTYINFACGISRTILNIAAVATRSRHAIYTLGGDAVDEFKSLGIELYKAGAETKLSFLTHVKEIKQICAEKNISVLHCHHRYFDLLSYLGAGSGIKTVTTVHSIVRGKKFLSYKSPLLIAPGESVCTHLINYFGILPKRIKILHNAVLPESYSTSDESLKVRQKHGISPDDFVFLFVGRFDKEKGIDILLPAFLRLLEGYSSVRLVLAGSGTEEKYVEEFVSRCGKIVTLSPSGNIADIYKECNAVVLPSRVDPFPLVMLETGLFSLPFIGSAVNGIAEFIEDGKDGILVPPGNVELLVRAMESIVISEERRNLLGTCLHKKVAEGYTASAYVNKLEDIYKLM